MTVPIRDPRAEALQGRRAGIVTRVVADAVDYGVVSLIYAAILIVLAAVRWAVMPRQSFSVPQPPPLVSAIAWIGLAVIYFTTGWAANGRTIGKQVAGLRVVTERGGLLGPRRAFLRALVCAPIPIGAVSLAWSAVSHKNAAAHDLLLDTVVVYDWRYRTMTA